MKIRVAGSKYQAFPGIAPHAVAFLLFPTSFICELPAQAGIILK
jgi:hypothetical protein